MLNNMGRQKDNDSQICPRCGAFRPLGSKRCWRCERKKSVIRIPSGRIPIVTIILIGINAIVFLWMTAVGEVEPHNTGIQIEPWFSTDTMLRFGAQYTEYILRDGEWWRLLTGVFLHFDVQHLFGNMFSLGLFGIQIEKYLGRVPFLIGYLCTGLLASVATLYLDSDSAVSAGASGAAFGLIGIVLIYTILSKQSLGNLTITGVIAVIAFNVYYGIVTPNIGHIAHIGGLIGGVLFGILLYFIHRLRASGGLDT